VSEAFLRGESCRHAHPPIVSLVRTVWDIIGTSLDATIGLPVGWQHWSES
jgi:hypothetical protein